MSQHKIGIRRKIDLQPFEDYPEGVPVTGPAFEDAVLTTEHAASSYGQPVLLYQGQAIGPADATAAGLETGCGLHDHEHTPEELRLCRAWHQCIR